MNGSLLRVLIGKKFFNKGVEVDAIYRGRDLSGSNLVDVKATFTIVGIRLIGESDVALEGASTRDGSRRIFFAQSLVKIDGMDPIRFAASVGIDEHGEKIVEGKRRGRKPKNRIIETVIEEPIDDLEDDDEDEMVDEDLMSEIFA